jgi:hypothetical protein
MDKRYQVFVSSTHEDLIEERLEVMRVLLELNCIPCGMEYFPAANENKWTFIKKLIDICDYYIVIIAGKYGSEYPDGKSYTRMEYEYALSKKIPTMGFVHHDLNSLPPEKRETEGTKQKKLDEFISLVKEKPCKFWKIASDLGGVVSISLNRLTVDHPRTGWVRGVQEPQEIENKLRDAQMVLKDLWAGKRKNDCAMWSFGIHGDSVVPCNDTWAEWISTNGGRKGLVAVVGRSDLDYYNFGDEFYFFDFRTCGKIDIPTKDKARREKIGSSVQNGMVLRLMPRGV